MNIDLVITFIFILLIIVGGVVVYRKDPKANANRYFLLQCITLVIWGIVYRFTEYFPPEQIHLTEIFNVLSDFAGLLFMFSLILFTYYFPKEIENKTKLKIFGYAAIPISLLSLTPYEPAIVEYDAVAGIYVYRYTLGIIPYAIVLLFGVYILISNLVHSYKNVTTKKQKSQSTYVILGMSVSSFLALLLTLVWPFVVTESTLDDYAPLSMMFYLFLSGKAVIQTRLFDFKIIASRLASNFITGTAAAALYIVASYFISIYAPDGIGRTLQIIYGTIYTATLIYLFYYIEDKIFNIIASKVSKDLYNPQNLIDHLNKSIVSSQELETLLRAVADSVSNTLNSTFCGFYVRETSYIKSRFISNTQMEVEQEDLENIRRLNQKIRYKIHSTEVEPVNEEEVILNEILHKYDVEVLGRLVDTTEYEVAGIGFMLLGSKRSGSIYSEQDLKILEIIANELVIAIENALKLEEIELFNVTLQRKIDSATRQLKLSNEELKALDEAKDEFISMASHQLRTPLTSIKGYLSLVLDGDAGEVNDKQKDMLGEAFFSSQRMVYLISDLLNVSRLKTGKFLIETKPVYLPDIVESEISQLTGGASAKDIKLEFTKPKEFCTLKLDETKTRQVIMNFIDNAIYYTHNGGNITVTLKDTGKSVEFKVKDNGIGVPKRDQHKLFTKFYRADNAKKARPDGTGLGLFMAKKVIVAQGGSLLFSSKVGKGSTFGFTFPKDKLEVKKSE